MRRLATAVAAMVAAAAQASLIRMGGTKLGFSARQKNDKRKKKKNSRKRRTKKKKKKEEC